MDAPPRPPRHLRKAAGRGLLWGAWTAMVLGLITAMTLLMTGRADHTRGGNYGVAPPVWPRPPGDRVAGEDEASRPWRFAITPQGRNAAISLNGRGQLAMMIDIDGDSRYFVLVLKSSACTGARSRFEGVTLKTMKSGDYVSVRLKDMEAGPWSRHQIMTECARNDGPDHVRTTTGEMMRWFMHQLVGMEHELKMVDEQQPSAADAVMSLRKS